MLVPVTEVMVMIQQLIGTILRGVAAVCQQLIGTILRGVAAVCQQLIGTTLRGVAAVCRRRTAAVQMLSVRSRHIKRVSFMLD